MRSLPEASEVARQRLEENRSFVDISQRYGVSRQAVHKMFRRYCEVNGIEWRTRRILSS